MHLESYGSLGVVRRTRLGQHASTHVQPEVTFQDLQAQEEVRPSEVIHVLWLYADATASLNAFDAKAEIDRSQPALDDLKAMQEALIDGITAQSKADGHPNVTQLKAMQGEYANVLGHVGLMLDAATE